MGGDAICQLADFTRADHEVLTAICILRVQSRILDAKGLPSFTYLMTHQQLSVRTAAARALRNLTAYASKQNKSLVAHNGGAKTCIATLIEV